MTKTNRTEWEARDREARAMQDFNRAPEAIVTFTPYPTEDEVQARMAADRIALSADREYEDDDRDDMNHVGLFGRSRLEEDFDGS